MSRRARSSRAATATPSKRPFSPASSSVSSASAIPDTRTGATSMAAMHTNAAPRANSRSIRPIFKKMAARAAESTIPKFSAQPATTLAAVSS